MIDAPQTSN